ncbi:MAG: hypothetical protein U9O18_04205, partial [Chloroflexota bacterium]|nr:hypothetical protein [Chloroflexota bacterium]
MTAIERAVTRFAMNMVAAVGLALLLLALHAAMAPAVEAASPTSAFGWGSEIGDRIATGHSGYADSTDHTFTATESNGFTSVQIRDAGNSLVAVITATGPDGARLVAGTTYADTSYDSSPGVPRIDIFLWDLNGGCSGIVGSFTVHDVAYAGPVFERLSMSVALTCWGNSYGASFAGELRFDTSAPAFNAATIVEDPIYRNFIDRRIGQVSGTKTWTLRNPGPNTLAVGTATMTGPDPTEFEFLDDACSNTTLASGGTCTFGTRFAPTKRGEHQAFASMPVDTPLGHVQAWLRGDGYERTSTTVEAPAGWQFGRVDFTATVTPNPVRTGSYSPRIMFRFPDGGPGHTVSVDENGVATIWGTFAPGEYRVYAEFQYYEQYAPSRSSVKTFKVGETTHITLLTDDNPALPPERPTITARLHNTVTPYAGGELIIEDVTVGVVLGRLDVSAGQQRLEVQPELSIGPHVIRASYSGHDIHSPSTAELTQRMTLDATAAVAPAKFYPYVDGYLDELHVTGRRNVSTAVGVRIWHRDTEEVYFDHTTQPATGDYRISWLGVDPGTGELAPEGVYRIAVTLDGGGTAPTVVNDTAVVRHDWVEWKKKSVTLPGKKFWLYGWSRNG